MAMLACIHFVSWVVPVENGQHRCRYCGEIVTKKTLYPKIEELGAEYQKRWDAHEATGPAPAAPPAKPAETKPAEVKPAEAKPAEAPQPAAEAK